MVFTKSHFITVFDREIHVVEQLPDSRKPNPDLPILWCLHGLTRTHFDFEAFGCKAAESGYRVLSPDFLGRGLSSWSPAESAEKEYGMKFYVPLLTEVLKQLGVDPEKTPENNGEKVVIVGQSMGGIWGWNAGATLLRKCTAKLVLIDVGPELHIPGLLRIGQYTNAANDTATYSELRKLYVSRFQTFSPCSDEAIDKFLQNHARRLPSGRWALHCDPAAPANLKNDVFDITTDEKTKVWGAFGSLDCPIAVIRGGESDLLVPEGIEKMRQHCKNGHEQLTAVEIAGVGHVPLFQSEEEIAVLMKQIQI